MNAATRPLDHYCGVCRYALDRNREVGKPDRFEHTASYENWTGPAHDPAPVPMAELVHMRMVCDICSAPEPAFAYRFTNLAEMFVDGRGSTKVMNFGDWWMICKDCAGPVDRADVPAMIERAKLPFLAKRQRTDHIAQALAPVFRMLLLVPPVERLPAREVRW